MVNLVLHWSTSLTTMGRFSNLLSGAWISVVLLLGCSGEGESWVGVIFSSTWNWGGSVELSSLIASFEAVMLNGLTLTAHPVGQDKLYFYAFYNSFLFGWHLHRRFSILRTVSDQLKLFLAPKPRQHLNEVMHLILIHKEGKLRPCQQTFNLILMTDTINKISRIGWYTNFEVRTNPCLITWSEKGIGKSTTLRPSVALLNSQHYGHCLEQVVHIGLHDSHKPAFPRAW